MLIFKLLLTVLLTQAEKPDCTPQGHRVLPELEKAGDIIIGGIFSFRTRQDGFTDYFTKMPEIRPCKEYVYVNTAIYFFLRFIVINLCMPKPSKQNMLFVILQKSSSVKYSMTD